MRRLTHLATCLIACCVIAVQSLGAAPGVTTDVAPRFGAFGFDTGGMDRDMAPGDDFFRYANGTWLDTTPIPADRPRYGMFTMLREETEARIQRIIADAAARADAPGSNAQLVGDLYKSWMDVAAIEAAGLDPAQPFLAAIERVASHGEAAALFATQHHHAPFSFAVWNDPADPDRNILRMFQGGLGMGNRDYYLQDSERFASYRADYLVYIDTLFALAGLEVPAGTSAAILEFETRIAESHWTSERSRQATETYNVMTVAELDALAPALDLPGGMTKMGLDVAELIVYQPSAIAGTSAAFAATDLATIRAWMTFHFISARASWLPAAFDEVAFDFYGRVMNGQAEQRPRDRRGVEMVNDHLGDALGKIYIERHFSPAAKARMEELVADLVVAFRGRLEQLPWMDEETRAQALLKLSTFEPRIGYPEVWDDYDGLVIHADDYFGNRLRLAEFAWTDMLAELARPVDRREWYYPPQTVNAGYSPLQNQITFPAGILQAPFFDLHADMAVNFGAIGGVIGHEIGHGFDDQGRRYDAGGRLRDWWTPVTNERFLASAAVLGGQYDNFCPLADMCINGNLSMGENIGDLGGLQMAYSAWRAYVDERHDGEAPVIDGFTGDQRFFLAWAQVWRDKATEDATRAQIVSGPHSPSKYRVNGPVRNLDAWYEAFGVTPDHALYLPPEQRVRIW